MLTRPRLFSFILLWIAAAATVSCDTKKTPDAPAPNPYTVSGTLTYTGSLATVGTANRLAVELKTTPDFIPASNDLTMQATTNGSAYTVNPLNVGTYYLVAFFGAVKLPCDPPSTGSFPIIHQGDPYYFYNGSVCGTATPLTITSGQPSASVAISFDDTCLLNGVSGSLSYSGSHSVSSTNGIVVMLYLDSGYATRDSLAYNYQICNNTTYNVATNNSAPEYLMAFVDVAGTGAPATGDPFIKLGPLSVSPTLTQAISFGDTNLVP